MNPIDFFANGKKYTLEQQPVGDYVDGKWNNDINGTGTTDIEITASVQPKVENEQVQDLTSGQRKRARIVVFTETAINLIDEAAGKKGDVLQYKGRRYEAQKSKDFTEWELIHYEVEFQLIENDET